MEPLIVEKATNSVRKHRRSMMPDEQCIHRKGSGDNFQRLTDTPQSVTWGRWEGFTDIFDRYRWRERKHMKKKMILTILTGILATGILSACGNPGRENIEMPESAAENTSPEDDLIQSYFNSITLETAEQKGVCGNDLIWFYKDNVLVIQGTGPMTDYEYETKPWAELKQEIQWVMIDNGCTHIGNNSFCELPLSKIILPDSLQSIGDNAFKECSLDEEIISKLISDYGYVIH